jgi:hypothetical protein
MNDFLGYYYYSACCRVTMNLNGSRCPVCACNLPYRTEAKNLREGDVVIPHPMGPMEPHVQSTVKQIFRDAEGNALMVALFRPYVVTSDFISTAGVGCSIGVEEYQIVPSNVVTVLQESRVTCVRIAETDEGRIARAGGKIARTPDGGLVRVPMGND